MVRQACPERSRRTGTHSLLASSVITQAIDGISLSCAACIATQVLARWGKGVWLMTDSSNKENPASPAPAISHMLFSSDEVTGRFFHQSRDSSSLQILLSRFSVGALARSLSSRRRNLRGPRSAAFRYEAWPCPERLSRTPRRGSKSRRDACLRRLG